ncbi:threonine/serine dehydratase [Micromonospora sp. WMMA1363]|uniref:threonine ammonia-lyase n=1 Tax=Micromonospora sp. WMMA1363 TaxID=3053985 RepID=UPI00259CC9B8|nr:threonine/serine dehydratase [Micromonospora sp. WMMA1363]MDM4721512.1 threonine/serine dehydratase [Micromonospora sp. WMMA1363]
MSLISLQDVRDAARRLDGIARDTPVVPCDALIDHPGWEILVKAESLQNTGSFKVRGAANALLARQERGDKFTTVVTYSAGNHGAGAAYAGSRLGLDVIVCMPTWSTPAKVEAVRRYGGEVVFTEDLIGSTLRLAAESDSTMLHPFDDNDVIAGQGTIGLELLEQVPEPDAVVIPVGGGGLVSGLGTVLSALSPRSRIIGVEPVAASSMAYSLSVGEPASLPAPVRSVADGLTAPAPGAITFEHARRYLDDLVQVEEDEILRSWARMLSATRLFVEPSGATPLAAVLHRELALPERARVVLIASGGNAAVSPSGLDR